ncbi:MAG: PAS domain S-box protein [Planctomycetota bacterium]|jgi:PAS domain S-box-containing protein
MTQHLSKIMPRNKRVLFLGLLLGMGFWIAEGVLHIVTFHKWTLADAMLPPESHEFWMRSLVTCMFVGFGFYAQLIINKLYESRERYRALFENAPDAIFLADVKSGQILDANPAASDLLLYPHKEIISLHQSQIHPPTMEEDSKRTFTEYIEHIQQENEVRPLEYVALRSDGVEVPVEIMAQLVHIGGRQVVQGVFRNVSERMKAKIELENSNERFRTVLDSLDALVYVSDMDTHEILFANKYGRDIWGDIAGKTCWKTLQSEQTGPCEFCTNDMLLNDNGKPTGIHRWEFQNTVDNQWYDCHDQAIPWTDGRLVRMEIATNITDSKQAENKLRETKDFYESILEGIINGVWVSNRDDVIHYTNKGMEIISGVSSEQMRDCHVLDDFPKETLQSFRPYYMKAKDTLEPTHYDEIPVVTPVGRQSYQSGWLIPLIKDNAFDGMICTVDDVTERKQAKEALQRHTELLDAISHAQSLYITQDEPKQVFDSLLNTLVKMTDSEYGFLDDVLTDDDGQLYKKSLALSNIAWDENSQNLYEKLRSRNLEFRNLHNLSGAPALTGELVISNDPSHDPRSGGVPQGHPSIHSFMGIPMFFGGELVGVAGVANRKDGYSEEIASFLETFISTCAGIIHAVRNDRREKEITEALRYSEEKYRRIIEDQTEFIVRWRPDGIRTFVNDSYCKYFGKSRKELVGTSFFPLISEEDWKKVRKRIESLSPDNPVSTDEHRVIRPDGSIGWNQWTDRAIFNEKDQLIEFQSTGRDITERKLAEIALRQHDEFLRNVLESLTHPFLVINANDYTVDMANSAAWKGELAEGLKCYEVSHKGNCPCCDVGQSCPLEHIKKTGLPMVVEHVHYDQLGNARNVEVHGYPLCDDQGKVIKIIEYCHDVTERRQAEEALKESKEFSEKVIETANAIIVVLDSDGTIRTFNKFAEELTGYRKNEVLRQNWFDLFIPEDKKEIIDGVHKKVLEDSAETSSHENFILTRNGEKRLIDWSNHSITGSNQEVVGTIAIGVDITGRKQAQEKERISTEHLTLSIENMLEGYALHEAIFDENGQMVDFRYMQFNPAAQRILGIPGENIIGKTALEMFPSIVERGLMDKYNAVMATGEPAYIEDFYYEGDNLDKAFDISCFRLNEVHFVCIFRDITERKKAQEQLAIFKKFTEASGQGLGMADLEGRIVYCNEALCRVFLGEDKPEDVLGKEVSLYYEPQSREKLEMEILPSVLKKGEWAGELPIVSINGKVTPAIQSIFLIRNDIGEPTHFANVITDITERKKAEELLQQSTNLLRESQEVARLGHYVFDALTGSWESSQILNSIFGIEEDYPRNVDSWLQIVHPDQREEMSAYFSEVVLDQGRPFDREYRITRVSDQQVRWVHGLGRLEFDKEGKLVHMIGTIQDVTERKKAEEERDNLAKFPSENPYPVFRVTENGIVIYANQVSKGFLQDKFNGINKPVSQEWQQFVTNALKSGSIERIETKYAGNIFAFRAVPIAKAGYVNFYGIDITDRKRAEEVIRSSEEKFSKAFHSSPDSIAITSVEDGRLLEINEGFEDMFGYPRNEVLGKTTVELNLWHSSEDRDAMLKEFEEKGRVKDLEIHIRDKAGDIHDCLLSCELMYIDAKPCFVSTARDITERKKTEKKLIENQAHLRSLVSQLTMIEESERKELAGILHDDLIQRLVMCKMRVDELGKSKTMASRGNSLDEIGKSIREMIKGTRSLTFDLCSPVLYDIGLEAAIRDWFDREVSGKYDTTFEFKDDGQQRQLSEDLRIMLYRAVRELCTNVIKHSKAKKAKVSIRSKNNDAEIIVEDNGIGIKMDKGTSNSTERGGLGLFGIRERLDHFGASMNIESEVGTGTRITITVPMNR